MATVLISLLAACSASPTGTPAPSASSAGPSVSQTGGPSASPAASAASPTFPVMLTDDEGNQLTISAAPQAIVSLTPAATETVFALGIGDRLVGKVEDPFVFPPQAAAVPAVAKFGSVDVERIVGLHADLVIAGGNDFNPPAEIAKLRTLGIPVLTVYGRTVQLALGDIDLIGRATGRPAEASRIVAGLRAAFDQVAAATRGVRQPRVYYELDASNGYYGPAPDYFGTEMLQLAGSQPLTSGTAGVFQIPEERIIAFDPEVILLGDAAYGVSAEQVAARPGWASLTAVRQQAIRPVDDVIITRPGPRLAEGLTALARAIHPDLPLPTAPPAAVAPSMSAALSLAGALSTSGAALAPWAALSASGAIPLASVTR